MKSKKLFQALRDDRPLAPGRPEQPKTVKVDVAPRQIRVQVYNGTPKDGLGRTVDDGLRATGFATTRAPLNGEPQDLKRTLITYDPRWDRSAKALAIALPGAELRAVNGQGATMKVTAGADFEKVQRVGAEEPHRGEFDAVRGDQVACP